MIHNINTFKFLIYFLIKFFVRPTQNKVKYDHNKLSTHIICNHSVHKNYIIKIDK